VTTTEPRLSAGVVIVRSTAQGWRYLLLRAYRNWDFPKGMVEPGEQPLEAARREVREETGLTVLRFDWGEVFRETPRYATNKIARYYVAVAPDGEVVLPVNPQLGHAEHDEFRWLDHATARERLVPRLQAILDWARARVEA
jgi:8-oxo-dGTP pyrophosphatase MutT (NUDIX family)